MKQRLERGLSFIEFNYQLLQAYDYLTLYRTHGCTLQMGGDDQWGNILAGVDLIGMDMVEVAPAYDVGEITALAAASLCMEMLYLYACRPGG